MKITKLHLLLFSTFLALGFFGSSLLEKKPTEIKEEREEEKTDRELSLQRKIEEEISEKVFEMESSTSTTTLNLDSTSAPTALNETSQVKEKNRTEIIYAVRRGDSLWTIAKKKEHFGLGHRWYDIWKANEGHIPDFDRIVAGQPLTIPLGRSERTSWKKSHKHKKEELTN